MTWLSQARTIILKDLRLEWRGRSRFLSVVLFGVVTLLLFSFAVGPDSQALSKAAAGFLVLALLLSSTLGLTESFRLEEVDQAIEGLYLIPVDPLAIYYGKASGNTLFLVLLAPILAPIALILYSVELSPVGLMKLFGVWILTALGLSAPGTLYAAMTSRIRSQDVLLPLLLFPLVVPVLMAAVKSMALILQGDPMSQISSWTWLLISFNIIYWSVCGVLFSYVTEDLS